MLHKSPYRRVSRISMLIIYRPKYALDKYMIPSNLKIDSFTFLCEVQTVKDAVFLSGRLTLFKILRKSFFKASFKLGNLYKNLTETKNEDILRVANSLCGGKRLRKEEL
jgi:hypothetical protein